MGITKDSVQLELTIGGEKAGQTLKDLRNDVKNLSKELAKLPVDTEEFKRKSEELRVAKNRLAEVENQVKGIGQEMSKTGSGFKNFAGGLGESLAGLIPLGAAAAGAFAAEKLLQFGMDSVSAYNEAENAAFDLYQQLVVLGGESEESFNRLMDQADALEAASVGVTAEQIQATQKQLQIYGLNAIAIEKLTPKILDYSKAVGKDMASATDDVVKAIQGQDKALKLAGIRLDDTELNLQGVTKALDKFAGTASSQLQVGTNWTERFSDQWGKVEEWFGSFLSGVGMQFFKWLTPVGEGLMDLWNYLTGMYNIFKSIILPIVAFISSLAEAYPILGKIGNVLWELIKPFGVLGNALKGLVFGMSSFAASVIASVLTIRQQWNNLGEFITQGAAAIGKVLIAAITNPFDIGKVVMEAKSVFSNAGSTLAKSFRENYDATMQQFSPVPKSASEPLGDYKDMKIKNPLDDDTPAKVAEREKQKAEVRIKIRQDEGQKIIKDLKQLHAEELAMAEAADLKILESERKKNAAIAEEQKEKEKAIQDIANRSLIAQADMQLLLAGKNEEAVLQARIARIITGRNIELQNEELTAEERKLIIIKAETDIASIQEEFRNAAAESQKVQIDITKDIQSAMIDLAMGGLAALNEFAQISTDKQMRDADKIKDQRLKKLEEQHKKSIISDEKYSKEKERIEAETESKIGRLKTEQARKNKALAIVQSIINTALAVTSALAQPPGVPATIPFGIIAGAAGAMQTALIAAKSIPEYQKGGGFRVGDYVTGPSHAEGGIALIDSITGTKVGEMEGGEMYHIYSRNAVKNNRPIMDALLYSSMYRDGAPIFASGGVIASAPVTKIPQSVAGIVSTSSSIDLSPLLERVDILTEEVRNQKTELEAYIRFSTIEDSMNDVNYIRKKAGR